MGTLGSQPSSVYTRVGTLGFLAVRAFAYLDNTASQRAPEKFELSSHFA